MKISHYIKDYFYHKNLASAISIISGYIFKSLIILSIPLLMKHLIDVVIPMKNLNTLSYWSFILILVSLALIAVGIINVYLANRIKFGFSNYLKSNTLEVILNSKWNETSGKDSAYLTSRIEKELDGIVSFLVDSLLVFFKDIVTFLITAAIMLKFNIYLAAIFFLTVPFYALSLKIFNKGLKERTEKLYEEASKTTALLNEYISGRLEIKYLNAEKFISNNFLLKLKLLKSLAMEKFWYSCKPSIMAQICSVSSKTILFWFGGYLIIKGELTIGSFVAFNAVMSDIYSSVGGLVNMNVAYQNGMASIKRANQLLSFEQESESGVDVDSVNSISLQNVSFFYDEQAGEVLKNINLSFDKNNIYAIAGMSGSGKTTLSTLIGLINEPSGGDILINGINSKKLNKKTFRKHCSVIQQDPFLFASTILENIRIGNPDSERCKIVEAAKKAQAHEFISKIDEGYEYVLIEKSNNLSGGQKQRIAISRSFLRNASLFILDEATTGLDKHNINEFHNILIENKNDKITIIISHSIDTLMIADKIVFVNNGIVEAFDSHQQLIRSCNNYVRLFQNST